LAKLRKDRERISELIEGEAVPRSKIEDLDLGILAAEAEEKLLQKQIANTTIRAPLSGILTFCAVERGSVVAQGIPVAHITNLDRLLLMVKVSERDVLQVQKNQKVRIVPDVRPDAPLSGQVTNIAPKADSAFTYLVEIAVANSPRSPLLAGMHARAQFVFEQGRQALTIPRRAVVGSLREASVFVVQGDTLAEERRLQIGRSLGERVEVSSGLTAGEPVVVEGQTYLNSGARVRIVN
jgi:RND family efflux transporter MFP subunit